MMKKTGLRSDYLRIAQPYGAEYSFGGCQRWFEKSDIIRKQGCGLIAMADLILYLAKTNVKYSSPLTDKISLKNTVNYNDYLNFVYDFNNKYVNLNTRFNVNFRLFKHKIFSINTNNIDGRMGKILNNYFSDNNITLKAKWGLAGSTRTKRIKSMLYNNIPAIISVGPSLFGKINGINCYKKEENDHSVYKRTGQRIINHYFTVTAITEDKAKKEKGEFDSVMYEISSWGKKYYAAESEIKKFSRYNSSLFTNVLFIKENQLI